MKIEILDESTEQKYQDFILRFETVSFFVSLKYRNFLRDFLSCRDYYLLASDGGEIKGALPLFAKETAEYGTVFNSLPFYGSNGGAIAADIETKKFLLDAYQKLLAETDAGAGTIVTAPFEKDLTIYEESRHQYKEMRIGQITVLPETTDRLMGIFHQKTRSTIRKAAKMNVVVDWKKGLDYLNFLFETQKENMDKIGVPGKSELFFRLLSKHFEYGTDYRIYVAATETGEPIAALLCFYFNRTTEYFVPATVEHFREFQPMSLIIYEAMKDALDDFHCKFWNWGGTAPTQKGVYDFKKRWGTSDLDYFYYTNVRDERLKNLSREILLAEFPYFFVLPFSELKLSA